MRSFRPRLPRVNVRGWGAALCAVLVFGAPAVRADAALFFVRGVGTSSADQRAVRDAAKVEFTQFNQPLVDQTKNASCADDASCRAVVLKRLGDANGIGFELFRVGQNLSVTVVGYRFDGEQALRYEKSVSLNDGQIVGTLLNDDALAFFSAGRDMAPLPPPPGTKSPPPTAPTPTPTPAATPPKGGEATSENGTSESPTPPPAPSPAPADAAPPSTPPTADDAPPPVTPQAGATVDEDDAAGIRSGYIVAGAGAVLVAAGAIIAAMGTAATLYGVSVRSDPNSSGADKQSAQYVGWGGLGAIGWSGVVAAGGVLLIAVGVGWALAEGE